eukprot:GHVS01014388.1.p1 GENE.GHVS01014388.1~~GHVS01014388.1.p1  ORF type:complete len:819 (+),score=257.09 GHVS01014388.1:371-2827(+)
MSPPPSIHLLLLLLFFLSQISPTILTAEARQTTSRSATIASLRVAIAVAKQQQASQLLLTGQQTAHLSAAMTDEAIASLEQLLLDLENEGVTDTPQGTTGEHHEQQVTKEQHNSHNSIGKQQQTTGTDYSFYPPYYSSGSSPFRIGREQGAAVGGYRGDVETVERVKGGEEQGGGDVVRLTDGIADATQIGLSLLLASVGTEDNMDDVAAMEATTAALQNMLAQMEADENRNKRIKGMEPLANLLGELQQREEEGGGNGASEEEGVVNSGSGGASTTSASSIIMVKDEPRGRRGEDTKGGGDHVFRHSRQHSNSLYNSSSSLRSDGNSAYWKSPDNNKGERFYDTTVGDERESIVVRGVSDGSASSNSSRTSRVGGDGWYHQPTDQEEEEVGLQADAVGSSGRDYGDSYYGMRQRGERGGKKAREKYSDEAYRQWKMEKREMEEEKEKMEIEKKEMEMEKKKMKEEKKQLEEQKDRMEMEENMKEKEDNTEKEEDNNKEDLKEQNKDDEKDNKEDLKEQNKDDEKDNKLSGEFDENIAEAFQTLMDFMETQKQKSRETNPSSSRLTNSRSSETSDVVTSRDSGTYNGATAIELARLASEITGEVGEVNTIAALERIVAEGVGGEDNPFLVADMAGVLLAATGSSASNHVAASANKAASTLATGAGKVAQLWHNRAKAAAVVADEHVDVVSEDLLTYLDDVIAGRTTMGVGGATSGNIIGNALTGGGGSSLFGGVTSGGVGLGEFGKILSTFGNLDILAGAAGPFQLFLMFIKTIALPKLFMKSGHGHLIMGLFQKLLLVLKGALAFEGNNYNTLGLQA